jgi:hypothetical protein
MSAGYWKRGALAAGLLLGVAACATSGEYDNGEIPADPDRVERAEARELPVGYGTLRQDDVTLSLRSGDLLIKVTPLDESITRLTAPDTYDRLSGLARSARESIEARTGMREPALFFVSVFSNAPNVPYEPEDLNLMNRGMRHRPVTIQPLTPGWGTQRLEQRQTRSAVYAFDQGIDLESDLQVEYQGARNDVWSRMIPMLQAERARVQARGGP